MLAILSVVFAGLVILPALSDLSDISDLKDVFGEASRHRARTAGRDRRWVRVPRRRDRRPRQAPPLIVTRAAGTAVARRTRRGWGLARSAMRVAAWLRRSMADGRAGAHHATNVSPTIGTNHSPRRRKKSRWALR